MIPAETPEQHHPMVHWPAYVIDLCRPLFANGIRLRAVVGHGAPHAERVTAQDGITYGAPAWRQRV